VHTYESLGIHLRPEDQNPENVLAGLEQINTRAGEQELTQGFMQSFKFAGNAARALGIDL
jgi:hypothetical protein